MTTLARLLRGLYERDVRFVGIGVWAANHYARTPAGVMNTRDKDLFLPPDAENLLSAWQAGESVGLGLFAGKEPLDRPRDRVLARTIVERRALTHATDGDALFVDFTLVMAGFEFETVWRERRIFYVEGIEVPVARLTHIVASKASAGRPKDLLFLETMAEELKDLMEDGESGAPPAAPR